MITKDKKMITINQIRAEIDFHKKIKDQLTAEFAKSPEGSVYYKKEHGKYRPYTRVNGKEKYLNRSNDMLVRQLSDKKEILKSINLSDTNLLLLNDMLDSYTEISDVIPKIVSSGSSTSSLQDIKETAFASDTAYSNLENAELNSLIDEWKHYHYCDNEAFTENKKQKTSDGSYLRSKSELIIYEYLKANDIPFKYERPLQLGDNFKYPDFTLLRKDGFIVIWEHFGMLDDPEYFRRANNTIYLYLGYGFFPYENFIISFDREDGSIDLNFIDRVLRIHGFIQ